MAHILDAQDPGFPQAFDAFLELKRSAEANVDTAVAEIIADVRSRGIDAVLDLTQRLDHFQADAQSIEVSPAEIDRAITAIPADQAAALQKAADRIQAYHSRQLPEDADWTDETGARLGWRWTAVDRAGLYVPGGLASYPSSVLMNAVPARVAGVRELVICAPTPDGQINPLVLLAARIAGVDRIFRVGGAQAVAAMAYGAGPIPKVDKITGPGNAYVASAKRMVYGTVGIDMIAGPSEVLVIADKTADPDWVAMDLMAQAEHDETAQSILITDDAALAGSTARAVDALLKSLDRRDIAAASWRDFGAIITVADMAEAASLSNRIAPEHLEILTADPDAVAADIRHAGAIFLGAHTPEAIGDYVGGPNHVLPTAGSARFSSGLSVLDFMKRTTLSAMTPAALKSVGPAAVELARAEGLEAHGLSVVKRLERLN
ncbi:MAG: histidinol dehydrogenase [Pseudomonadota bacterium]